MKDIQDEMIKGLAFGIARDIDALMISKLLNSAEEIKKKERLARKRKVNKLTKRFDKQSAEVIVNL